MRIAPGADHPTAPLDRQERYPFPYFAPTPNAAVFRPGAIAMQWAFVRRSRGMALSGDCMTSENTVAASSRRLVASSCARSGVATHAAATIVAIINLMLHLPSFVL